MPGQRCQRREGPLERDEKGQKPNCRRSPNGRSVASAERVGVGVFYRRMRAKLGAPKAITAVAHKLAPIIFHTLTTRQGYDESVFAKAEQKSLQRMENRLRIQAQALGYTLLPAQC